MSLPPSDLPPIPATTAAVARAAFLAGNVYMQMRDKLGTLYANHLFTAVYPAEGQPGLHPWQLALDELAAITKEDIFELLGIGLSPARQKCALLAWEVLRKGILGQDDLSEDDELA